MGWRQARIASRDVDRLLTVLVAGFVITTVLAVVAPWLGLESRAHRAARHGFAAWDALVWLVSLVAVLWRSRSRIRRLKDWLVNSDTQVADYAATSREWTWESDRRLVMTSCGPAVARLLGRSPAEMVGRSMFDFIDATDVPRVRSVLAKALEVGRGWDDVELTWQHADGHQVVMAGTAVPVWGPHGEIIGFRGSRGMIATGHRTPALVDASRRIQRIIDNEEISMALQPIIDLTTHRCIAVEALARFHDSSSPAAVFPMAEEVGRGVDLELLTLRLALRQLSVLPDEVALSVNASPNCVLDPRFAVTLAGLHDQLSRVIIEITEHNAVGSYSDILAAVGPLRARGLRLAVDDTGAGYASFSHVLNLRPDIIKIDRSLIIDIDRDLARRSFITALMLMALDLGAVVTAEGIERPEELQAITNLGVDHAQGYLIGRPTTDSGQWETWRQGRWIVEPHSVA